jgi:hypothetical protein
MANTVTIQITSVNRAGPGIASAITQIQQLTVSVHQAGRETDRTSDSLARLRSIVSTAAGKVLEGAANVGKYASAALAAAQGTFLLGRAFAAALTNLAPLVSFLPSLIGSLGLVQATVKLMAPGFVKAFSPITGIFKDAKGEASAFTKRLQDIAGIGIKPLAQEFVRLNIPAITTGMEGVAYQLNGIVFHVLRLLNTTRGMEAIRVISDGTKKAFEGLSPHVIAFADAIIGLTARAGDKGITAIGTAIGKLLDKLTEWANNTTIEDIKKALSDLSGYGGRLRDVFGVIRDVGKWMGENQALVKAFSDTVATATIAIGIATGNIPAILAGSAVLVVNHWKGIKETFGGFASELAHIFDGSTMPQEVMDSFREFSDQIAPTIADAMETIMNAVRNNKEELIFLGRILADYVIPILGYIFLDTIVFVGKAIENCVNVVGTLTAAFRFAYEVISTVMIDLALIVVNQFDTIIGAAAKAFGWVPGIGPKLQQAANEVHAFVEKVNNELKNIRDEDVYVRTHFVGGQGQSRGGEYRTGGIIGGMSAAATGGVRQGLVKVGEEGEEFVRLPTGSMVYPKANTNQMQAQSGGSGGGLVRTVIEFAGDLDSGLAQWFMNAQRTGAVQIYQTAIA